MLRLHSFGLLATFFGFFSTVVHAIILQDLPHSPGHKWPSRSTRLGAQQEDCGVLELRSTESFLWGGKDGSNPVLGNLTVRFPSEEENVLSMQRFKGMTKSVTCSNETNRMEIAFQDKKTFECAKTLWDWVNGADNHTFVMVAGTGDCGWNDRRVPFIISTIQYDEDANMAHLAAKVSQWSTAAHSYELNVGTLPVQSIPTKRDTFGPDFNKDLSVNFEHQVPNTSITFPTASDISVTFACLECNSRGSFQLGFHLETEFFIPQKAFVTLSPRGVKMDINPKATFSASLLAKKRFSVDLIAIPLGGITIADIVDLGPEIVFQAGVDAGPLTSSTTFSSGSSISLEDSAQTTIDLLGAGVASDGWKPTVSQKPLSVDAKITGELKAFLKARIQLSATAFDLGYTAGMGLSPYVSANMSALASTSGACVDDVENHAFGVSAGVFFGVELKAEIEQNGQPIFEKVIWDEHESLASLCLPFGPTLDNTTSSTSASIHTSSPTLNSTIKSSLSTISTSISPLSQSSTNATSTAYQ